MRIPIIIASVLYSNKDNVYQLNNTLVRHFPLPIQSVLPTTTDKHPVLVVELRWNKNA
jgi:hypothetical protein